MNELKIYKPFKPFIVTQKWGNRNQMYKDNGFDFSLHNGIDANTGYLHTHQGKQPHYPVYCPVEGFVVHLVRDFPKGGGREMWLRSKNKVKMFERECYAYLVMAHGDRILVKEGYEPKLGELIMIADNTGFSTGPHTHIGLYRIEYDEHSGVITWIDSNEANGSFSPHLFLQDEFAVDKADMNTLVKSGMRYVQYLLT